MTEISLELSTQKLYGWEFAKAGERIGAMVRALESGETLPPVSVFRMGDEFYLDNRIYDPDTDKISADGGHHRAVAHMLAGLPIKAILNEAPSDGVTYEAVALAEIKIVPTLEVDRVENECLNRRMEETMSERWEAYGEA